MKQVRLGVIGAGSMGCYHISKLAEIRNVQLVAVCDVIPERARVVAEEQRCAAYVNHRDLLRDKLCDAILIATPHYAHTNVGVDALRAGLHVLVEKPISVHKADCERLIAAHKTKKQIFAAMFNQRTDPRYRKLRQMVQDGSLGKLDRITWIITDWFRTQAYYTSGGWRATWAGEGGGVLLNQCQHNFDLWQWMFGMPQRIRSFCKLGRKHRIEVEDDVTAYLEYDSGCSGILIASTGEAPGTNRLEVAGEHGNVVIEGNRMRFVRNEVSANTFLRKSRDPWQRPSVLQVEIPVTGTGGQHGEIMQNFVDAIVEGKPLLAPAVEGVRAVELANTMLYSSETGRTVQLPLNARAYEKFLQKKIRNSMLATKKHGTKKPVIRRTY